MDTECANINVSLQSAKWQSCQNIRSNIKIILDNKRLNFNYSEMNPAPWMKNGVTNKERATSLSQDNKMTSYFVIKVFKSLSIN